MVSSFVAELARRLQGQSAALALPLTWIEQRLSESGFSIEQLVQAEAQEQAGAQVSIGNTIGSLRLLGSLDWREFVETMSAVEHKLREDPGGLYGAMDFATRDRYRHAVESIARMSPLSESDVARRAVQFAHEAAAALPGTDGRTDRRAHVGYYLIDAGRPQLHRAALVRATLGATLRDLACRMPLGLYVGSIATVTLASTALLLAQAHHDGIGEPALFALGALLLVASSSLAVGLVNWLASLLVTPTLLPRMDHARGVAADAETLVVVPTMLGDVDVVAALVEALEVRFLANRDPFIRFGLLTDFADAATETLPGDRAMLQRARAGIEALNAKYPRGTAADGRDAGGDTFHLFHRPRVFNPREGVWMGRERKRGKLADLNALLRGSGAGRFCLLVGATDCLARVRFVVTLDTDTELPRDAARRMAGVLAHPLNRARVTGDDDAPVRVGYGILQPRVSASLPGAHRSWYARLQSGEPGVDPYTRAVSDVYQDVFGEGSFIGKGIYDVDAFERTLGACVPGNRVLSHDLLEGCYARSGLVSDVEVYEDYPADYGVDLKRRRRWIRGDWQLLAWLLPRVPGPAGPIRNPLSALSRWKLFDNLRRSLVPAAQTLLLLVGWALLPHAWLWTLAVLAMLLLPQAFAVLAQLVRPGADVADGPASRGGRGRGGRAPRACRADSRVPAVRGHGRARLRHPCAVAHLRVAAPPARVESVRARRRGCARRRRSRAPLRRCGSRR